MPKFISWNVKVGEMRVIPNYKSSIQEDITGHYLIQFIWKVDQMWNNVKLESDIA